MYLGLHQLDTTTSLVTSITAGCALERWFLTPCIFCLQCPFDDGVPAHRVCVFKNLVMFQGQLFYIYSGELLQMLTVLSCFVQLQAHCATLCCFLHMPSTTRTETYSHNTCTQCLH